jgi:hypothetical protein
MASTSTQPIALAPFPPHHTETSTSQDAFQPTNPDAIIAASRLADANVPEGGYGWVIVISCFAQLFWLGTSYSWGIFQAALLSSGLGTPSTLSFVGSVETALMAVLALLNAMIIRKIGSRNTSLIGVALLGLGQILSGFCTESIVGLFICVGFIVSSLSLFITI